MTEGSPAKTSRLPRWLLIGGVAVAVLVVITIPVLLLSGSRTDEVAKPPPGHPGPPVSIKCPNQPPGPSQDAQDVSAGPIVPGGWDAVTVCTKGMGPAAQAKLIGANATKVVAAVNQLKPGKSQVCTKEFGSTFRMIVTYPNAKPVIVDGETHGCQQVTAGTKSRLGGKAVGNVIKPLVRAG